MVDLVITAASVIAGGGARITHGIAGATITAGQVCYLDTADNEFKLSDTDSATALVRTVYGIALNGASDGQPLAVQRSGNITIGATVTQGVAYYLSGTAGGICPIADVAAGDYPAIIGIATSATVLKVAIVESGVVL